MMSSTQHRLRTHMAAQCANAALPTRWGSFRALGFQVESDRGTADYLALQMGDIHSHAPLVRIHSRCLTGDALGSLRCDCQAQLHLALEAIAVAGAGVLLYEPEEGRGIGLMEKLRSYGLQDAGLDTVDANLALGHPVDARTYQGAAAVLLALGMHHVRLMTNNPDKVQALEAAGIRVVERVNATAPHQVEAAQYLKTKRERLGHHGGARD